MWLCSYQFLVCEAESLKKGGHWEADCSETNRTQIMFLVILCFTHTHTRWTKPCLQRKVITTFLFSHLSAWGDGCPGSPGRGGRPFFWMGKVLCLGTKRGKQSKHVSVRNSVSEQANIKQNKRVTTLIQLRRKAVGNHSEKKRNWISKEKWN